MNKFFYLILARGAVPLQSPSLILNENNTQDLSALNEYKDGNYYAWGDPALKAKGGHWRVPTLDDYRELVANCTVSSVILDHRRKHD